jgi:hypothetical protein
MQGLGQLLGQVRDVLNGLQVCGGQAWDGRIAVEQLQQPAGREVIDQGGEFGEDAGHQVVQAGDVARGLLDLGLQAGGHLAEQPQLRRDGRSGVGLLDDGEARHGLALGVVGGAFGEVGLLIVFVAFGLADGNSDGQGQAAEEVFDVDGVLAGSVDADDEVSAWVVAMQ